ncbi:bacillithiol biosynthesis cysteine-adding enzyme BshC [Peribacillus huizhouensis]|uniref:Putative cysteine ligase BshC n=1 Tax=Peribacillus huizhouensis TaxID=1501239 RepID=A0ABR6CK42_9BACI|nr:bacillithiol biosynthesis cysteine-adding enzyme BshC [Peribacillus huizhouensis]MBA9024973.1 bacillithiol biosynthesis cysteine-adding enzyme BshC [Peribacillus huizhouensis]
MELKDLALPSLNAFASDYLTNQLDIDDFFHYSLTDEGKYNKRYQELMSRNFFRAEVADYIENYMEKYTLSIPIKKNIEAFRKEDSVVVIGGQQAGLLTGPLYTIHKVISIIKLAEEQEKALGKKVIPVFWIAGEDHDLAEVNHVYTLKNGITEKNTYPFYHPFKSMISDIELDTETAQSWVREIIESYGETEFTNKLLADTNEFIKRSTTFVEFFACLIHTWFHDYGLLLIDAADPELRKLESEFFAMFIDKAEEITAAVQSQQIHIQQKGYKRMIDMQEKAANLFYYDPKKKDRILLEVENGIFSGKNKDVSFTQQELHKCSRVTPERLSNNVVTRPIMQEMLFPVLAFISGPGEIAYWAELKQAFELFSMKMPPIVPRLNITILERGIATDLNEVGMNLETVLTKGTKPAQSQFLNSVKDDTIEGLFYEMKAKLNENHAMFTERALTLDKGLDPLLQKNRQFIEQQLDFIYGKVTDSSRKKHEVVLNKYERIQNSLFPLNAPQERMWNIFYYVNKYGTDFINELVQQPYTFNNEHKVIYL